MTHAYSSVKYFQLEEVVLKPENANIPTPTLISRMEIKLPESMGPLPVVIRNLNKARRHQYTKDDPSFKVGFFIA